MEVVEFSSRRERQDVRGVVGFVVGIARRFEFTFLDSHPDTLTYTFCRNTLAIETGFYIYASETTNLVARQKEPSKVLVG